MYDNNQVAPKINKIAQIKRGTRMHTLTGHEKLYADIIFRVSMSIIRDRSSLLEIMA